jgi:hypothetical protein
MPNFGKFGFQDLKQRCAVTASNPTPSSATVLVPIHGLLLALSNTKI